MYGLDYSFNQDEIILGSNKEKKTFGPRGITKNTLELNATGEKRKQKSGKVNTRCLRSPRSLIYFVFSERISRLNPRPKQ